jgi:hypothetical protein
MKNIHVLYIKKRTSRKIIFIDCYSYFLGRFVFFTLYAINCASIFRKVQKKPQSGANGWLWYGSFCGLLLCTVCTVLIHRRQFKPQVWHVMYTIRREMLIIAENIIV